MIPLQRVLKPGYKNTLVFLFQGKYFSSIEVDKVTENTKVYVLLFYIVKRKAGLFNDLDISGLKEKKILQILKGFTCVTKKSYDKQK